MALPVRALRLSAEPEAWLVVAVEASDRAPDERLRRLTPEEAVGLLERRLVTELDEVRSFAARTDRFGDAAMQRVSDHKLRERCRRAVLSGEWVVIADRFTRRSSPLAVSREGPAPASPEPAPSAPPPPRKKEPVEMEVEVQVLDAGGKPRRGLQFKLETPDGNVLEGRLDGRGSVWTKGTQLGPCRMTLMPPDDGSS